MLCHETATSLWVVRVAVLAVPRTPWCRHSLNEWCCVRCGLVATAMAGTKAKRWYQGLPPSPSVKHRVRHVGGYAYPMRVGLTATLLHCCPCRFLDLAATRGV